MDFLKERYNYKRWEKRALAYAVDLIGYTVMAIGRSLFPEKHLETVNRILVIRLDQMGDIVMTCPAILALKEKYPAAEIDCLIGEENLGLFENEKAIQNLIGFKSHWFSPFADWKSTCRESVSICDRIRKRKYDLGIDFRGDVRNILLMTLAGIPHRLGYGRTGLGFFLSRQEKYSLKDHQVDLNFNLIEHLGVVRKTHVSALPTSQERQNAFRKKFQNELGLKEGVRIIVHPAAGYPSKQWGALKFWELIRKIINEKLGEVILIGTERDQENCPVFELADGKFVDLRGKTELADLPVLFNESDYYIGNDSGPAHLAAAQGLECLLIVSGTSDPQIWKPSMKDAYPS